MKILLQIGIVFGIYWVSQGIESLLPIPFPASIISLLLLLLLLGLKVLRVEHVKEKADFLLNNLGFFFIPASVGVVNYLDVIAENAVAFATICFVSTILTFIATVGAVRLTRRFMEKKGGKRS